MKNQKSWQNCSKIAWRLVLQKALRFILISKNGIVLQD